MTPNPGQPMEEANANITAMFPPKQRKDVTMTNTNSFSTSDEMAWLEHIAQTSFWADHVDRTRPLGYQPPPAPAPAALPTAEDALSAVGGMDMASYSQQREALGMHDNGGFIGKVEHWQRPVADAEPFVPAPTEMETYTQQRTLGATSSVMGSQGYVPPAGRLSNVRPNAHPLIGPLRDHKIV